MPDPIRNWEQWERDVRRDYYAGCVIAWRALGHALPVDDATRALWVRECNEYVERERARLLAEEPKQP